MIRTLAAEYGDLPNGRQPISQILYLISILHNKPLAIFARSDDLCKASHAFLQSEAEIWGNKSNYSLGSPDALSKRMTSISTLKPVHTYRCVKKLQVRKRLFQELHQEGVRKCGFGCHTKDGCSSLLILVQIDRHVICRIKDG